ncbi:hypothetical protein AVEN_252416-1 [Araneus ventricosus]|uniref:Uncharacterized protein n=1 Tax=Araneus ventricosus TaxID=182803 RepID=A0A4Y2AQM5_ARAVE|nr:hypothetical protein AVEN_252416-1 [Araneus ventricosus]
MLTLAINLTTWRQQESPRKILNCDPISTESQKCQELSKDYITSHVLMSFPVEKPRSGVMLGWWGIKSYEGSHRHLDDEMIRRNRPLKGFCQNPPLRFLLPYSQLPFLISAPLYVSGSNLRPLPCSLAGAARGGVSGLFSTFLGFMGYYSRGLEGGVLILLDTSRVQGWHRLYKIIRHHSGNFYSREFSSSLCNSMCSNSSKILHNNATAEDCQNKCQNGYHVADGTSLVPRKQIHCNSSKTFSLRVSKLSVSK